MSLPPRRRVSALAAALTAAAVVLPGPSASAVQVPVPSGCSPGGPTLRYVVLFRSLTPERVADAEIERACGATSAYYPSIGVAVATSADRSFGDRLGPDRAYSAESEALGGAADHPVRTVGAVYRALGWAKARTSGARDVATADRTGEQWNMELIRAPEARAVDSGSRDVVVGVLDSGVDRTHPDLVRALDPERSAGCLSGRPDRDPSAWEPTGSTHGTHVAGTIAAADDGHGITGVAPGVRIAAVKVVDDDGFIYPEYAVCGFMWAAQQRMRVTNSSYFVDPWLFTCTDQPGQAVAHEAVRRAVRHAAGAGVLNVAAVGNEGSDLANPVQDVRSPDNAAEPVPRPVDDDCDVLPAELRGVTAVSAVGAERQISGYSSYGDGVVDLTAPGGDLTQDPAVSSSGCVLSTIPDGYGYACGTSMAAPHAAGVAALLASTHPDAGPEELASQLADGAVPLPCPGCGGFYGRGLVNALHAVTP